MPKINGPILDSTGRAASGVIHVRVTRAFDSPGGLVTQARARVDVRQGQPFDQDGQPWHLPVTPPGAAVELVQDLDGELVQKFIVTAPDREQMTYSELLFYRDGTGMGTTEPFFWNLTGGIDFPPGAVPGDWGVDLAPPVGNTIRFYMKGA